MKHLGLFGGENSHEKRKVLNIEDVLLAAKQLGFTYQEIADLCKVSKTMVSNWGSKNRPGQPFYHQIKPFLKEAGSGHFNVELEPLSPAAVKLNSANESLFIGFYMILILCGIWFASWKPCSDNWNQCKKLKWYKMPIYGSLEYNEQQKAYREFKKNRAINNVTIQQNNSLTEVGQVGVKPR